MPILLQVKNTIFAYQEQLHIIVIIFDCLPKWHNLFILSFATQLET